MAVWALGIVSLLGIPGQILLGHASDRIGREAIWAVSCTGFAICFAALTALKYQPSLLLVYVMVFAQGMLGYGLTSVMGAVILEIGVFGGRSAVVEVRGALAAARARGEAGPQYYGVDVDPAAIARRFKTIGEAEGSRILAQPQRAGGTPWLQDALANLGIMYEAIQAVSHILDLDQLLERIMDLVFRSIDADRGCIMLLQAFLISAT